MYFPRGDSKTPTNSLTKGMKSKQKYNRRGKRQHTGHTSLQARARRRRGRGGRRTTRGLRRHERCVGRSRGLGSARDAFTGRVVAGSIGHLLEARTADARLVRVVEHDAAVAKKGADTLERRGVKVHIRGVVLGLTFGDFAMLSAQVAHLACLGQLRVADGRLGPVKGVEMGECSGAVAVLGNGCDVEVVHYGRNVST